MSSEYLQDLDGIEFVLESGKTVKLMLKRELQVPHDPQRLAEAAEGAHSQLAFWGYQAARLQDRIRTLTDELQAEESRFFQIWERYYREELERDYVSNDALLSRVRLERGVRDRKKVLREAQAAYDRVHAIHEALIHRAHLLRKITTNPQGEP